MYFSGKKEKFKSSYLLLHCMMLSLFFILPTYRFLDINNLCWIFAENHCGYTNELIHAESSYFIIVPSLKEDKSFFYIFFCVDTTGFSSVHIMYSYFTNFKNICSIHKVKQLNFSCTSVCLKFLNLCIGVWNDKWEIWNTTARG